MNALPTNEDGLSAQDIAVHFGNKVVIEQLDLDTLRTGTVTALLGPNGSGKSTLLRTLAGLVRGSGQVNLNGQCLHRCTGRAPAPSTVYLPQALPAGVHLTVLESVLAAAHGGRRRASDASVEAVQALLRRLGILHLSMHFLDQLSGGQRQLAGLAQALIRQPAVLLLDEPLSALDLNRQQHVMQLIRRETRARGLVTVVVLHDLNIALRYADHAVMLQQGRVVADGLVAMVVSPVIVDRVYEIRTRVEACSRGEPHLIVEAPPEP